MGSRSIFVDSADIVDAPMWYHEKSLMQTATGYGRKLNTGRKLRYNGRLYRIYCCCYSNAGSNYIIVKGETIYIN
jgi:hypothetical protein